MMARVCLSALPFFVQSDTLLFDCATTASQEITSCDRRVGACHGRASSLTPCFFVHHGPPAERDELLYSGSSVQAVDWDGDGDIDLLAATPQGSILQYERVISGPVDTLIRPHNTTKQFLGIKIPKCESVSDWSGWVGPKFHATDWDTDGDLDLLVVNHDHTLSLWEKIEGKLVQARRNPFQNLTDICAVQAVDWDGDGDLDLLLGTCNGNLMLVEQLQDKLQPHQGDKDPFQGIHVQTWGSLQAVDWDGDSDIDLFVSASYSFTFFERLSNGALVKRSATANPLYIKEMRIAASGSLQLVDWNQDGLLDVLTPSSGRMCNTDYCLALYIRTTSSTWVLRKQTTNPFASIKADEIDYTYATDWDSDGDVDLLVHKKNGRFSWLERVKGAGLLEHPLPGAKVVNITCLQAIDVDNDGRLEVLLCNSGGMRLYSVTEPYGWSESDSSPFKSIKLGCTYNRNRDQSGAGKQTAYVHDLNSDGFLDVLDCGCNESCPMGGDCSNDVTLHLGNADGFVSWSIPVARRIGICQTVDFDLDGILETFVGVYNQPPDTYQLLALDIGPPISLRSISLNISEKFPSSFQLVDWEVDGQLDIVAKGTDNGGWEELLLYTRGFCEVPTACNGVGKCTADGSCECPASTSGFDCSSCAAGYWGRNVALYSAECFPCPGVGTLHGICEGRGVCNDDSLAQANAVAAGGSRLSMATARGDGNCSCSEWFSGADAMGRINCLHGECPTGFELRADASGTDGRGTVKSCQACLPGHGKAFPGNSGCTLCVDNQYAGTADGGICRSCGVGYVADRNRASCSLDTSFVLLATGLFLIVLCWASMLPALLACRLFIEDISHQAGKGVVVTTTSSHFLLSRCGYMEVSFSDTGIPWLDKDGDQYYVLPLRHKQLLLRGVSEDLEMATDTSCGHLSMRFPRSLISVGINQIPFIFLFACCTGSAFALVAFLPRASVETVLAIVAAAMVLSQGGIMYRFLSRGRTPLARALAQFKKFLAEQHPHPKSSPIGAGRAINMIQLLDFFDHFQGFIRERNMYYVCKNILLPVTRLKKLSYAELAGPSGLQWFVSHYWGTPFRHFAQSIRKHAETSGLAGWKAQRYWICSFSNNQWQLDNELGEGKGYQHCSFYLALRSGNCLGTAMVFDDDAMPLERSWCLFELLQTFQLSEHEQQFQGLFLCTPSGVLNTGMCSIDAALGIVHKLSDLRLQDAQASLDEDKQMIDRLVMQQPGGFAAVNRILQTKICDILAIMQTRSSAEMESLQQKLQQSISTEHTQNCGEAAHGEAAHGEAAHGAAASNLPRLLGNPVNRPTGKPDGASSSPLSTLVVPEADKTLSCCDWV